MVGGDEAAFATAEPLMRHFGKAVTLMAVRRRTADQDGQPDLHRRLVQALSEGIAFAEHAELDVAKVLDRHRTSRVRAGVAPSVLCCSCPFCAVNVLRETGVPRVW